jgi:hypothetical protein
MEYLYELVEGYSQGEPLEVGCRYGKYTVKYVSDFTVIFKDKEGWEVSIQVPWKDGMGNLTNAGYRAIYSSVTPKVSQSLSELEVMKKRHAQLGGKF